MKKECKEGEKRERERERERDDRLGVTMGDVSVAVTEGLSVQTGLTVL